MHIVYSLFLFISASVLVYCIFLCVFFSFDATILVNKDVYKVWFECGWQVKLCDPIPIVTHGPYLSALEIKGL